MDKKAWYDLHKKSLVDGGFKRFSTGPYAARNIRLVKMLEGYKFKAVIEVAGAEGDLAEKVLAAYPDIEKYYWSDLVTEAVDHARSRIDDPRFKAMRVDLDEEIYFNCDLFISTSLEHTLRYREIIDALPFGTLVLLSLPNFDYEGHRVHFPQITDVIKVYGDRLKFLDIQIFVAWMGIKDMLFIALKRSLEKIGMLKPLRRLGILKKEMGTDNLLFKWLVLARREYRPD